jgi:multidrug efflux system outer membrane protein
VAYNKTRLQVSAYQLEVESAQSALKLANVRYRGGVDTYLTVLDSERALFTARLLLAQARGASLAALVQLYQALGGGWQQ